MSKLNVGAQTGHWRRHATEAQSGERRSFAIGVVTAAPWSMPILLAMVSWPPRVPDRLILGA